MHPQSQAAYDMLSQGLCRPVHNQYPLVYSIKCIELNEPYFTIGWSIIECIAFFYNRLENIIEFF